MVRVGIVGTSWWAEGMYLPALQNHPHGQIVAACGRDPARTAAFAQKWNLPLAFTNWQQMIASGEIDALIVATPNSEHHPITMAALDAGLHVLCEKPLALNAAQALEMAQKAHAVGVKHMVAFTHRWLPVMRYAKHLLEDGFIGQPYHLNMRYYGGGGRRTEYRWRSDAHAAGSGVLMDLGSHWLHYARWFFGEITGLSCRLDAHTERETPTADETALITVKFRNGAVGSLMVSMIAWEGTDHHQTQRFDFHGSDGTLYLTNDWDTVQEIRGVKSGQFGVQFLELPETFWDGTRRDTVRATNAAVFNTRETMARAWLTAIAEDLPCAPDFHEGARVQQLLDAATFSAANASQWVEV